MTETQIEGNDVIPGPTNSTDASAVSFSCLYNNYACKTTSYRLEMNPFKMEQSFLNGFLSAFSMILTSELLDKTFFIAVVMAMRHPRWVRRVH